MRSVDNQTGQKNAVDEIVDYTAELPLAWQEKILWMAKGMKYTRDSMDNKKNVIEKNIKLDMV